MGLVLGGILFAVIVMSGAWPPDNSYRAVNLQLGNLINQGLLENEYGQTQSKLNELEQNNTLGRLEKKITVKLRRIVQLLKTGNIVEALRKAQYIFDKESHLMSPLLEMLIFEMWMSDMKHLPQSLKFMGRLPPSVNAVAYRKIMESAKVLNRVPASALLGKAFKVRQVMERNYVESSLSSALKSAFPKTVRDIMWHTGCRIKNQLTGHYLKESSEKVGSSEMDIVVAGNFASAEANTWRLVAFQKSMKSPVHFRIENVATSRYLTSASYRLTLRSVQGKLKYTSEHAWWAIKFPGNRVTSGIERSPVHIFSTRYNEYAYEADRRWEKWRCGIKSFQNCGVLSDDKRATAEAIWILEC